MANDKFITADPNNSHRNRRSHGTVNQIHTSASTERRRSLERYLNSLSTTNNFQVILDPNAETAQIRMKQSEDEHPVVTIPTYEDLESPLPDVSNEVFRAMVQYANALHEYGHHQHTDQYTTKEEFNKLEESIDDKLDDSNIGGRQKQALKQYLMKISKDLMNAIEDGAIEEAIRNEHPSSRIAQRLYMKNNAFIASPTSEAPEERRKNVSLDLAVHTAAMDLAKVDTGALRRLVDDEDQSWQFANEEDKEQFYELYEDLQEIVIEALTIGNPQIRTKKVFKFIDETVIPAFLALLPDPEDTPDRDHLRNRQQDDVEENESGEASQQQSQGLSQNSKQQIAQQHSVITVETSTSQQANGGESDEEKDDSDQNNQNNSSQENGEGNRSNSQETESQSKGSSTSSEKSESEQQSKENGNSEEQESTNNPNQSGETSHSGENTQDTDNSSQQNVGSPDNDQTINCPNCGSENVEQIEETVKRKIGARVNAPFNANEQWVDDIEFVVDEQREVCGFRVTTNGTVPKDRIEQGKYTVFDIPAGVEILEPYDDYPQQMNVQGYNCNECDNNWIPMMGGN